MKILMNEGKGITDYSTKMLYRYNIGLHMRMQSMNTF